MTFHLYLFTFAGVFAVTAGFISFFSFYVYSTTLASDASTSTSVNVTLMVAMFFFVLSIIMAIVCLVILLVWKLASNYKESVSEHILQNMPKCVKNARMALVISFLVFFLLAVILFIVTAAVVGSNLTASETSSVWLGFIALVFTIAACIGFVDCGPNSLEELETGANKAIKHVTGKALKPNTKGYAKLECV